MKKELPRMNGTQNINSGIQVKETIARIRKNWYVLAICAVLGIAAAIVYNEQAANTYEVSSTLLLKKDADNASLASFFNEQNIPLKGSSRVQDQIGILKSHAINLKTVQNLNWEHSWYENNMFNKKDLHLYEPFIVEKTDLSKQLLGIPVVIKATTPETYTASVDQEITVGGIKRPVVFRKEVKYGERLSNAYFDFVIRKKSAAGATEGQEYTLVFNDPSLLAKEYRNRLNVTLEEDNSDLIYLKLKGGQPSRDITYLNELGKVFIAFGLEEKNKVADNTLQFINNQVLNITDSLQVASQDFTDFRSKNKIVNLGHEASLVVENFEAIESEEAASKMKLEYYNNLKGYVNSAKPIKDMVAPSVVGITDASLNSLVMKLSELYSQRELLSYSVQEKNPELVSLDNTIQYTRKILTENINNLLANTKLELAALSDRKQKVNGLLSRLPKKEQDLINIKRSFDLNNDLYTFLLRKRAEVGIARASNNPDATVLDEARFDAAVYLGPNKGLNLLIGLILGLGIPMLVMAGADYFDSRIKNPTAVENNSALAVVGHIYTNKFKTLLPVLQHTHSPVTESFRTLRTNLYYLLQDGDRKVIAVHSPRVGEGKSFIAANLAAAFAINNKKVLLVESDLRQPKLYQTLKLNREVGLTTYLSEKATFEQIVQQTKVKGLHFVAAGASTPNNSELLNSKMFGKFVYEAKADFDFVVMDSVPTDILSDSTVIGKHADVNLMVLRMNYSNDEQLKSINKIAYDGIMDNMALILNDVSDESARKQLKKYGYV
jgi:tyrosine-protein kinase Etk/Wzc